MKLRSMLVTAVVLGSIGLGGAIVTTQEGCTKAQGVILESGIPTDVQTIWCVVNAALTPGANLQSVAQNCGASLATAAEILWEAGTTTTASADAGAVQSTPAVIATLAYAQAKTKLGK
jgi:hypothetical protein